VVFADRVPVVHGVEGRDLVYTHWWHLQYPRNLVHDTDAAESVLALSEVEERHNGGLLVLRGVPGDDLLDELLILGCEFERNLEVIFGGVAMLHIMLARYLRQTENIHTTLSEPLSFQAGRETLKARH
jgi:hypothetical protein